MSLITRCPACETMFKVVPDQLRISSGWVRCGQCSEVFDANAHFVGEVPASPAPASPPPAAPPAAPPPPPAPPVPDPLPPPPAPAFEATAFDSPHEQPLVSGEPNQWVFPEAPEPAPEPVGSDSASTQAAALPEPVFQPDPPAPDVAGERGVESPAMPMDSAASSSPEPAEPEWGPVDVDATASPVVDPIEAVVEPSVEADVLLPDATPGNDEAVEPDVAQSEAQDDPLVASIDDQDPPWVARRDDAMDALHASRSAPVDDSAVASPSFMRDAQRQATWKRPVVRAGLWLASLVLALGLLAQVVMHQGDQLAVREPRLKPVLVQMCQVLQCTIQAVKDKDALVIDGSAFNKLRGDNYRLALTVRNTAAIEIAMPAIELTLTDARDQPLVQRVLLARELTGAPSSLAAGGEWSGHLSLQVNAASGDNRVAGYRLLAFYP